MSAGEPGALAEREFASTGLAERSGAIAADTAALVPNFNASRRLILLLIAFLAALPRNHITSLSDTLCTGLSLDRSATHLWWPAFRPAIDAPNLAGRYQALGEGHGLLRLRRVAQFPARKIPCPAAFAGELFKNPLQQHVHVLPRRRVLRKDQMAARRSRQQRHCILCFRELRRQVAQIFRLRLLAKNARDHADSIPV